MDWEKGYVSRTYARVVDPISWRDTDEEIQLVSGKVSRGDGDLIESADLACREFDRTSEKWIRIYFDTRQSDISAHTPIFTGLASSPKVEYDGVVSEYPVECYSVLKPAYDIPLQRGWYAIAGQNGAEVARDLLKIVAPVIIDGTSPNLSQNIIAEKNESRLSMAWKILTAINWRIRIQGDGTIVICPKATAISVVFDPTDYDAIEPQVSVTDDWFSCPNVYMAVAGNLTAIARDDDPDSMLSTVTRGREVWKTDSSVKLGNQEGIDEYVVRRLKEEQRRYIIGKYTRRYRPDLVVGDIVALRYPRQELDGAYKIDSQDITLGYSANTSEEVSWVGNIADYALMEDYE